MDPYSKLNRQLNLGVFTKKDKSKLKKSGIMFRKGVIPKNAISSDSDAEKEEDDGLRLFGESKFRVADTEIVTEEFKKEKKKKKHKKKKKKKKEAKEEKKKKKKKSQKHKKQSKISTEEINKELEKLLPEDKDDFLKKLQEDLKGFTYEEDKVEKKKKPKKAKKEMSKPRSKSEKPKIHVKVIRQQDISFIKLEQPKLQSNSNHILSESEEETEDILDLLGISVKGTESNDIEEEDDNKTKELSSESSKKSDSDSSDSESSSSEDEGLSFVPKILRENKLIREEDEKKERRNKLIREENKQISRTLKKQGNKERDYENNNKQDDMVGIQYS
jgi:hypothetical protein